SQDDVSGIDLGRDPARELMRKLSLGSLNPDNSVLHFDFHSLADFDRGFAYSRHKSPNLTENFAADFLRSSLVARGHALRRRDNGDTCASKRTRHRLIVAVAPKTWTAHSA